MISRLPGLRRLPVFKLLAIAEIGLLAKKHLGRLTPTERGRLLYLVRTGKGRSRNLEPAEQKELAALVAKVEPRLFAGMAADKLSPVPLPRRLVQGRSAPRGTVHPGAGVGGPALEDPAG